MAKYERGLSAKKIIDDDVVLSRIAANILGLGAGDSFKIPSGKLLLGANPEASDPAGGRLAIGLSSLDYLSWRNAANTDVAAELFISGEDILVWRTRPTAAPTSIMEIATECDSDLVLFYRSIGVNGPMGGNRTAMLQLSTRAVSAVDILRNSSKLELQGRYYHTPGGVGELETSGNYPYSLLMDILVSAGGASPDGYGRFKIFDTYVMYLAKGGISLLVPLLGFSLGGNITLYANRDIIGDYILQPNTDGQVSLGQTSNRFKLVRAVTITSGDFVFENGWRMTEAERLGLGEGVAMVKPNGEVAQVWR